MNVWFAATLCLTACLVPCVVLAVRGTIGDALVALSLASPITVLAVLAAEQGMQRQSFFDVSLAIAVLGVPSNLLFARIYRRWL